MRDLSCMASISVLRKGTLLQWKVDDLESLAAEVKYFSLWVSCFDVFRVIPMASILQSWYEITFPYLLQWLQVRNGFLHLVKSNWTSMPAVWETQGQREWLVSAAIESYRDSWRTERLDSISSSFLCPCKAYCQLAIEEADLLAKRKSCDIVWSLAMTSNCAITSLSIFWLFILAFWQVYLSYTVYVTTFLLNHTKYTHAHTKYSWHLRIEIVMNLIPVLFQ